MNQEDQILKEDMEILGADRKLAEKFSGKTVFVTGATGLIGTQAVYALSMMNKICKSDIHVIAMVRNEQKAKKVFEDEIREGMVSLYCGDINEQISCKEKVDYIIHGASATSSKYFVDHPVETILTAIKGTRNILEYAKYAQVEGMVYLSSLEVYGTPDGTKKTISESDYGYIDPLSVRSSYSEGKRMAECLCVSYAKEYDVPVKIARLSQTFGAAVSYDDGRVFAEFARCVAEKKDIILHTQGNTVRTYCYTRDAVNAIFYILTNGIKSEAYNVTNMETAVSIRKMAELVCSIYPESGIKVRIEIPEDISGFGYNPEMRIILNNEKTQALGWMAEVGLADMYRRMIESNFIKRGE